MKQGNNPIWIEVNSLPKNINFDDKLIIPDHCFIRSETFNLVDGKSPSER